MARHHDCRGIITGMVASRREHNNSLNNPRPCHGCNLDFVRHLHLSAHDVPDLEQTHRFIRFRRYRLRHAGEANATSSIILRWKVQFACALVWWASAVAACFVSDNVCSAIFLVAIFLCQIVFGIYGMLAVSRQHKQGAAMPELPELNPVVHGKLRLALLSLLAGVEEAEFTWLRSKTGSTDATWARNCSSLKRPATSLSKKSSSSASRNPPTASLKPAVGRSANTCRH